MPVASDSLPGIDQDFAETIWPQVRAALPRYLKRVRWFGAKAEPLKHLRADAAIPLRTGMYLLVLEVELDADRHQLYSLPLLIETRQLSPQLQAEFPDALLVLLKDGRAVIDCALHPQFGQYLWSVFRGASPAPKCISVQRFDGSESSAGPREPVMVRGLQGEQSNTSLVVGDKFVLKLFRRLQPGMNPDVEVGCHLTRKASFLNAPKAAGMMELNFGTSLPFTLAGLQEFIPNEGDAWSVFSRLLKEFRSTHEPKPFDGSLTKGGRALNFEAGCPTGAESHFEPFLAMATRLGQRVGEMHLALANDCKDRAFTAEHCDGVWQQSLFTRLSVHKNNCMAVAAQVMPRLPQGPRAQIQGLLSKQIAIDECFGLLLKYPVGGQRIRTHGDLHLGQVLWTGSDFSLIDFEGEPGRNIQERRQKHSPLRDVAGMLRSFHYAASVALFAGPAAAELEQWLDAWYQQVSAAFLRAYFSCTQRASFLPAKEAAALLLQVFLLEKALYELLYEVNNRPDWIRVPLNGIYSLLGTTL